MENFDVVLSWILIIWQSSIAQWLFGGGLSIGAIVGGAMFIWNWQKRRFVQRQVNEMWPCVMLWVLSLRKKTDGQREMNMSHLREFFKEHYGGDFTKVNEEVLKVCWGKIEELDGISRGENQKVYIVRNW